MLLGLWTFRLAGFRLLVQSSKLNLSPGSIDIRVSAERFACSAIGFACSCHPQASVFGGCDCISEVPSFKWDAEAYYDEAGKL